VSYDHSDHSYTSLGPSTGSPPGGRIHNENQVICRRDCYIKAPNDELYFKNGDTNNTDGTYRVGLRLAILSQSGDVVVAR
jgi:hypothetical protein